MSRCKARERQDDGAMDDMFLWYGAGYIYFSDIGSLHKLAGSAQSSEDMVGSLVTSLTINRLMVAGVAAVGVEAAAAVVAAGAAEAAEVSTTKGKIALKCLEFSCAWGSGLAEAMSPRHLKSQ